MAEVIWVEREEEGYVNKWLKGLNKGLSGWPGKHSSPRLLLETTFFTFVLNADQYGFHLLISIMPHVICQADTMKLERAEVIRTFSLAWLSPVHQMPVIWKPIFFFCLLTNTRNVWLQTDVKLGFGGKFKQRFMFNLTLFLWLFSFATSQPVF